MALAAGARLGPYEIVAPLGAGGMGEVYKAGDTRLNRIVALKILSPELAIEPRFRERFEREAKTIAQLDHPHICALYDVGEENGTAYLVMPYLQGQTLASRLRSGALPLDQALTIAIQMADALDKAHRAGIVHRDIKPGNIFLTKSSAKLLDFGLARASAPVFSGPGMSNLPTTPPHLTAQGTILGTFQYMAPEQIEGQEADARTDIFAFGTVLYEMVTGRKAFEGKTQALLLGAIMHSEPPPPSTLRPLTPPSLDRVLKRCVAKDPAARWQTANDLLATLNWIAEDATRTPSGRALAPRARWRERAAWIIAAVAVLAAVALAVFSVAWAAPELPAVRLDVVTPPTSDPTSFALSPDGRQLVFVATTDSGPKLWLRSLDRTSMQPLAGTDGATYPFWAPDGRALGFFADGKLKRVDLSGGLPHVLANAPYGRGGAWSRDGTIVFAPSTTGPLLRLPASGGPVVAITRLEQTGHGSHRWPQVLPDGRRVIFFATNGKEASGLYVAALDGAAPRRVMGVDTAGVYASPGYLLVVDRGVLLARRLDLTSGEVADAIPAIPVAQPVGSDTGVFRGTFAVSATGVLAHRASAAGRRQLVWVDRHGTRLSSVGAPDENALLNPALAPDGLRVAVQRTIDGNQDIWVLNSTRDVPTRLTFEPSIEGFPTWSPDGRRVIFRSNRDNPFDLYEKSASGAGTEQRVLASAQTKFPLDWSTDGRFVLYRVLDQKTGNDLWALPMTGDRTPFAIVQTPLEETNGEFSPDGRWVAYDSTNASGRFEVFVQRFPGPGGKWQISSGGGIAPRWRRDGAELFYVAPDGSLMAVPVRASADGDALEPGAPVRLFRTSIAYGGSIPGGTVRQQYAVAPDGQRFLINVTTDDAAAAPITVVLNWTAALKK